MLATSWKPNKDATVWTFQLRRGVRFHNGKEMTSADVVASMKQYAGKGSNAGFSPFFDPSGVSAAGRYAVRFRLKAPLGTFPYLLSQTTYQAIIQPASIAAQPGTWVKSGMIGTGAFKLKSYTEKKGAELVRNNAYWGGRPALDGVKVTFFTGSAPLVLALRGGQIDLAMQLSPQEAQVFKNNSKYIYYSQPVSAHRQFCMRTDLPLFKDAGSGVRVALTINRPQQMAQGDARERPHRRTTTRSGRSSRRPIRRSSSGGRTSQLAKALLTAAGAENLKFTLTTWNFLDHPDHAASIQAYAREAGITVGIEVMDGGRYYDSEPPGADYATTTPWLWRPATLTEYGWRGVPEPLHHALLHVDGRLERLALQEPRVRLGGEDLPRRRRRRRPSARRTKRMAGLLLRDTPVVIDYFINYVTASTSKVKGYVPEGISQMGTGLRKTSLA